MIRRAIPMIGALALTGSHALAATITWTNTSGGDWSDANNWSPHQIPTNTDTTLITAPGTYAVVFDMPSYSGGTPVLYPSIVSNLTLGAGVSASGTQTLLVTNLSQYSTFQVVSQLLVTNGGLFAMTNGLLATGASGAPFGTSGSISIAAGGVFVGANESVGTYALTVANGGTWNSIYGNLSAATFTVTNGGVLNSVDDTIAPVLTVAGSGIASVRGVTMQSGFVVRPGGTLNLGASAGAFYGASLIIDDPSTNYGTINMTNGNFVAEDGTSVSGDSFGAFVNGAGGVFNLSGTGGVYSQSYLINQGLMAQRSGSNFVIGLPLVNASGTVSNFSGVFSLGYESNFLAGTYYAAPNSTIQLEGVDEVNDFSSAQLTLGSPLVLTGNGQFQLTSGYLYLSSNVPTNLQLMCDTVTLGPLFQGGTITNLTFASRLTGSQNVPENLINTLPVSGSLTATDLVISTNLVVNPGGVVTLNTQNPNFDTFPLGGSLTVAHGGSVSFISGSSGHAYGIGTATWTNSGSIILSNVLAYLNIVQNEAGGAIYLGGNCTFVGPNSTNPFAFINQGALVQTSGTNIIAYTTYTNFNSRNLIIYAPMDFDTSRGTVTNVSGLLTLPSFGSTLAGTFYAAAGATIQLGGGAYGSPTTPGTPLVLGGPGQYQFISGYLYCPVTVPPNLILTGGNLQLGPAFQGGVITNLILAGIAVSNSLPIKGPVTIENVGFGTDLNTVQYAGYFGEGIQGTYTIETGGWLTLFNCLVSNNVVVTNGGVLKAVDDSFNNPITVAQGGVFYCITNTLYAPATIAGGGVMNVVGGNDFYEPLTNSGMINLTNSDIVVISNSIGGFAGAMINQSGGVINMFDSTLPGAVGSAVDGTGPFINAGQINFLTGAGYAGLIGATCLNSGIITDKAGTLVLEGNWTFTPASRLQVGINSATSYGRIICTATFPAISGNMAVNGSFGATLGDGYVPANGAVFNVLVYGSETGSFSSLNLPSNIAWQSNYDETNFTLVVGDGRPTFSSFNLLGTNLIFYGTGGTAGSNYVILASTNVAAPVASWKPVATNQFDVNGQLHFTNSITPAQPRQFFIFKLP